MNWHAQFLGLCLLTGGLIQSAWALDKAPTPRDPETAVATGTQMEQKHQWTDAIDHYKAPSRSGRPTPI